MKSFLLRTVSMISWLITALFALNAGLKQLGWFDFFSINAIASNPHTMMIITYVIGVAGAISLIMYVLAVMHHGGCCGDEGCGCGPKCACDSKCKCDKGGVCPHCGKSPCICK